jgi:hypothetical protein
MGDAGEMVGLLILLGITAACPPLGAVIILLLILLH